MVSTFYKKRIEFGMVPSLLVNAIRKMKMKGKKERRRNDGTRGNPWQDSICCGLSIMLGVLESVGEIK